LLTLGEYRPASVIAAKIDAVHKNDVLSLAADIARGTLNLAALGPISQVRPYDELAGLIKKNYSA
jgi:hypothetical protein